MFHEQFPPDWQTIAAYGGVLLVIFGIIYFILHYVWQYIRPPISIRLFDCGPLEPMFFSKIHNLILTNNEPETITDCILKVISIDGRELPSSKVLATTTLRRKEPTQIPFISRLVAHDSPTQIPAIMTFENGETRELRFNEPDPHSLTVEIGIFSSFPAVKKKFKLYIGNGNSLLIDIVRSQPIKNAFLKVYSFLHQTFLRYLRRLQRRLSFSKTNY